VTSGGKQRLFQELLPNCHERLARAQLEEPSLFARDRWVRLSLDLQSGVARMAGGLKQKHAVARSLPRLSPN
jgi:hypothetical protein